MDEERTLSKWFELEGEREKINALQKIVHSIRTDTFDPDAVQDTFIEILQNEDSNKIQKLVWECLPWSQKNDELKELALQWMDKQDDEVGGRHAAMGYLTNRYPDAAFEWVDNNSERIDWDDDFWLKIEQGKALMHKKPQQAKRFFKMMPPSIEPPNEKEKRETVQAFLDELDDVDDGWTKKFFRDVENGTFFDALEDSLQSDSDDE